MARDFIFRIKPGEALPPSDPNGYRVLLDNQGSFKLLSQNGEIVNPPTNSSKTSKFLIIIAGGVDSIHMMQQETLIGGYNWYSSADGLTLSYNNVDNLWEFKSDSTIVATSSSTDSIPYSGNWDYKGGGTISIIIAPFIGTLDENIINIASSITELNAVKYEYTVVNISSAEILNLVSEPVTLLPAPGDGKYYDIDRIIFEFTYNSLVYNSVGDYLTVYNGKGTSSFYAALITDSQDSACVCKMAASFDSGGGGLAVAPLVGINAPLLLTSEGNITSGNGTLKAKIYYKVNTL